MAHYRPQTDLREAPFTSATAVVFIDIQNYNCHVNGAIYKSLTEEEKNVRAKATFRFLPFRKISFFLAPAE